MGFARIISGGPTGRYTIELDYGDAMRTAALAAINQQLLKIDAQLLLTQAELIQAEAREAAKRAEIQGYANDLIAAADQPKPTGLGLGTLPIVKAQRQLAEILAANQPIRDQLAALKFELANWRRKLTALTNLPTKVQRQAWCVDFTEDIPALAYSATCDIPGDPNLVLLAPGGRAWQASDGEFRARELLSPAQAFVNTAVYPGWQKWKPTYRWGTITAIDTAADRVNVALFDQKSDAQRLPVNQTSTLNNVPVVYMTCNAAAFDVGDRVIVQFVGQNWTSPRVIGFLDNPKPCLGLTSSIAIPGVATTVQSLFRGQIINGATAPAPPYVYSPLPAGTINAFVGWLIVWSGGPGGTVTMTFGPRSLPDEEWVYAIRPHTSRSATAYYYTPPRLESYVTQTLIARNVRFEAIEGTDPVRYNTFVSGNFSVSVLIYTFGANPLLESPQFSFSFAETGAEVGLGEYGGDPYAYGPPNIVFTPTGRYPSLSKTMTGAFGALTFSLLVTWEPESSTVWKVSTISPMEPT